MFDFLRTKKRAPLTPITTDLHSHLLPGIDDGVRDLAEACDIIEGFSNLGYTKLITTPHIYPEFYNNTEEDILARFELLKKEVSEQGIIMDLEVAAEYYLDDDLVGKVKNGDKLLTCGKNYLLFETPFINEPLYLKEFVFVAKSRGITPIMAHPERYAYIWNDIEAAEDLVERGVLLQVNINSLTGYYSKEIKKTAEKLIDKKLVHFIGSDCHNRTHLNVLQQAQQTKYYKRALQLPLKNHTL